MEVGASPASGERTVAQAGGHCRERGAGHLSGGVEARRVAAVTAELEPQRAVINVQLFGDQLLAALLVAGDHARHSLEARVRVLDSYAHVVADAQPLASRLVRDLDLDRPYPPTPALLPCPREVLQGVAAESACEDVHERVALRAIGACVQVDQKAPR